MLHRFLIFIIFLSFLSCSTSKRSFDNVNSRPNYSSHSSENELVSQTKKLIGCPYKYAGTTPKGFDCSGLTWYVYSKSANKELLRSSVSQATMGSKINLKQAKPGDLLFFKKSSGKINHVSVIVENRNNKLIVVHATSSKGVIQEDVNKSSYWKPKIAFARRIL